MRLALVVALLVSACGGAAQRGKGPASAASAKGSVVAVSPANFGANTYRLLLDTERGAERAGLLVGVTREQLRRAGQRFANGNTEAGLSALSGALFLGKAGEFDPEMLAGGEPALEAAAAEVARVGNDGRALALYSMLLPRLPAGVARTDVQGHLNAIAKFRGETRGSGPVSLASATARADIGRALFDSSSPAMTAAKASSLAWLQRALQTNVAETPIRSNEERDEAFEAYRAVRAGGYTLAALFLRHGDPRGSLGLLDSAGLERLMVPDLRDRLQRAADDGDADAWADLYQFFESARGATDGLLDGDLLDGATFGAAEGLFHAEPGSLRASLPLAAALVEHGMAEVSPLLLTPALTERPEPDALSAALSFVMRAVVNEEQAGGVEAARATFVNSEPILALASEPKLRGRVRPTPARLRYVMGAIEVRHGELARGEPLLIASADSEPSFETFMTLVSIERQKGGLPAALGFADRAVELSRTGGDPASETEAQLARFEIFRDQRKPSEAERALEAALTRALEAQRLARGGQNQARAESSRSRVIEPYTVAKAVRRATERAFEASSSDPRQLSATVLDAARRALTFSDLSVARRAVERAVDAGMSSEDVVYPALWLQLLERKLRVPSSGTAEDAYSTIDDASGWPSRLRNWATGRLSDGDLLSSAKGRAERTEAIFYTAMARNVKSGADLAAGLEPVAQSEAVDLVEVAIARELLARADKSRSDFKLPTNVVVP